MKARVGVALVVFWPWLYIAGELLIVWWAMSRGCTISAKGPEPCIFMGEDIGEQLYGLWAIGYHIVFSFFWVLPAVLVWALWEIGLAMRKQPRWHDCQRMMWRFDTKPGHKRSPEFSE